jgi:O-antigen/teichoic acid export membrane protein
MAKKSLTEKTMVVVFSRVLTSFIDLTTAILIARLLSKTDFAILGYLLMIYEVARYIATLGFPESIFYFFEHLTKEFRKAFALQTIGILTVTALISGLLILLVKVFASDIISDQFSESVVLTIQSYLPYIALIAVLEIPTWPVHNILLASDRQKEAGWYQVITSLMSFAALIGPLALGYSIEVTLYCMVGYASLRFIGSFIWVMLILPKGGLRTPQGNIKEQITFSLPLGISSLVSQFNKYADKFIVSIFLTEIAFGEYIIGAQEVPIIRVIPFAVGTVLISRYVNLKIKNLGDDLINLWYKGIEKVSLIVIPLTILSIVLAPYFIKIFQSGDTDYSNSIIPFQIYNLIILIRVAHYGSILQAFGDTKGILRLSISLVVLNILFSVPLTIMLGINGTAIGTLLANIINWIFTLKRIGGHLEVKTSKVIPMKYVSKIFSISVASGLIIYFTSRYVSDSLNWIENLAISSLIFFAIYIVIGVLTKTIKKEDLVNLKEMFKLSFLWK